MQAETALRKAIQLDPNYAAAHNNLAVIYLSQQPPLVELARWHYQKALDAGQPRNPDLEKALDGAVTHAAVPNVAFESATCSRINALSTFLRIGHRHARTRALRIHARRGTVAGAK